MSSLVLMFIIMLWAVPANYNHPLAVIINKTDALDNSRPPRVLLMGGSGLYNGIDSPRLERELGMPVFNLGLWAGFKSDFLFPVILPHLGKQDIIVLILEYGYFTSEAARAVTQAEPRQWLLALDPAAPSQNGKLCVLAVENSKRVQKMYETYMKHASNMPKVGFHSAYDAEEALRILGSK
ncbi:hypothetical protein ACFL5V_13490, partial [Fibrobacterota bacterium]